MSYKILITRPTHQSANLAEQIHALGGTAIIFPTLEILPPSNPEEMYQAIRNLSPHQICIFVSANAVHHCLPFWPTDSPTMSYLAIGPGTAQALEKYKIKSSIIPALHHSEGLLMLPLLQNVVGKKISIFCGENTRPLLKQTLRHRGATVTEVICYRRQCPVIDGMQAFNQLCAENIDLIISTSTENLTNLWSIFGSAAAEWLRQIPILVISAAMVTQANHHGFSQIFLANGASDEKIIEALRERMQSNIKPSLRTRALRG